MSEKTELHNSFIKYLKSKGLKFIRKNWNNHNRQVDDGYPDFIIFLNRGFTIFIEFKTKEKYLTKDHGLSKKQIEWKYYLEHNGHKYFLTYKLEDAISFVEFIFELYIKEKDKK
jgi:hypothetical protein